ncbi:MAG: ABC transporter substrate-binding protein, partial [Burkholderiales bacterium]|nr:ABC transporter substrate-binding protein [Burkholderiales bacterium]
MATLSGPGAALGQDQLDGFMLAVDQNGGKLGGTAVNLVKEDDQLKPDLGVQLVQKLIEKDKVNLVTGVTFSNVMMAVAKPLADSGLPFVGSNAGPAPLAGKQCSPNFFFTSFQNDALAEVMGQYANDKGYKKMVLMAPNYQSGKDQVAGFKRYYKGTVVSEVFTQINQPDYSAELAQLQAAAPDAVFAFYPGGMGVNFVKQMRQAGLLGKIPLLSVGTDGTTLPALRDSALGVVMGAQWGPDTNNPANREFTAAFEKRYGRIASQYAAQGFDAARLIDAALRKTGGKADNPAALRDALKSADFASVRGAFRFNRNGFPVQDMSVFE